MSSYLLRWTKNTELDVFEYNVYKDGQKMSITSRGGLFYVDEDVSGSHTYSISALTISGTESARSSSVSTNDAANGWWETDNTPPAIPSSISIGN